jgi:uncharacterized membrane protein YhaH (DUF805 family)
LARKRTRAGSGSSIDWRFLFLDVKGRIDRETFWIGTILLLGAGIPLQFLANAAAGKTAGFLVGLALLHPAYCVQVKRAHDRDRPGWLIGLYFALILAILLLQLMGLASIDRQPRGPFAVLAVIFLLSAIALTIDLGFFPGTRGRNAYGPDPLGQR